MGPKTVQKKKKKAVKKADQDAVSDDSRTAILDESLRVLREEGLRSLSIRKVARNLGFSHGAPYRHFPTREHLLAALAERGFTLFSAALLRDLPPLYATEKLELRLEKMCANYFAFAFDSPDYYQYIFGTSHFDHAAFPHLQEKGNGSFAILTEQISAMMHARLIVQSDVLGTAMFVFATMHGAAMLMLSGVTEALSAGKKSQAALAQFLEVKILAALRTAAATKSDAE